MIVRLVVCSVLAASLLLVVFEHFTRIDESPETLPLAQSTGNTTSGERQARADREEFDKWSLWVGETRLRGANIYQRRVYPELDGPTFMGEGAVGPPYTQKDLNALAALGANYVNISHPGLFTETPPYAVDEEMVRNLDGILGMVAEADMFAVISFRTGPGRSEFSVCCLDEVGDWFDGSYLNDSVWKDRKAQDAWVDMWRYTAERYRDNPIVAGYHLMVEPNANEVWADAWDPEEFHSEFEGTLYDWNQLHPRIARAIREVDSETPIMVGGTGYSAIDWLPYLEPTGVPRTVYVVHQYQPVRYVFQRGDSLELGYPATCDLDSDGVTEQFDRSWLDGLLATIDEFVAEHGAPVAVNEFGAMRRVLGAAEFVADQIDLLEKRGINHAVWVWDPSWKPWTQENDAWNFRHGPDPASHADVKSSDLMDAITGYWRKNAARPSTYGE